MHRSNFHMEYHSTTARYSLRDLEMELGPTHDKEVIVRRKSAPVKFWIGIFVIASACTLGILSQNDLSAPVLANQTVTLPTK